MQGELSLWSDLADSGTKLISSLNQRVVAYRHLNIGLIRFARVLPRIWHESLHFRAGIFQRAYEIENQFSHNNYAIDYEINDLGISLGFGVKFGLTKNQLDFGLNLINRSDSFNSDRFITNFNIGLTIGDIWFVKQRTKK